MVAALAKSLAVVLARGQEPDRALRAARSLMVWWQLWIVNDSVCSEEHVGVVAALEQRRHSQR